MKNTAILFAAGLIFGAAVGAVSFKAAKVNFNPAPTEQKVTSEQKPETNLSISIDGEEI